MMYVRVDIVGFVEEHQPNLVEARLVDALGQEHVFTDKCAIFTSVDLDRQSPYPVPGVIACHVITCADTVQGQGTITIDTEEPWHVADADSQTRFVVLAQQLSAM